MHRRLLLLMTIALLAFGLAACSSSKKSSSSSSSSTTLPDSASGNTIRIQNFQFSIPGVKPGETVNVQNNDSTTHTVTSDKAGQFDVGNVDPGKSATFTAPAAAGSYTFHCKIHSFMHGTLTVT
jgi:plastocyanin